MKLKKLSYKYIYFFSLVSLSLFVIFFLISSSIHAKVMTPIGVLEGTVRVNICGDYIAENPEECDRDDFKSKGCSNYGYTYGELTCSLACEIDSTGCYNTIPSEEKKIPETTEVENSIVNLPVAVQYLILFDEDGDGIISASEIPAVIVNWINTWKTNGKEGDLNKDGEANILDFSILMYHITYPD